MFKKIFILILLLFFNFLIIKPVFAEKISFPFWGPVMSCNTKPISQNTGMTSVQQTKLGRFADPCSSLCDFVSTAQRAIYLGMTVALFVLAPILFLIGAFLMIISRGNEKRLETGKGIFVNTIWGIVIVLSAFVIVNTIFVILGPKISTGKYSWSEIQCPANLPGTVNWNY